YQAFATPAQAADFRGALEAGLGWGEAKQALCERIEDQIGPMRERYAELMAHPERIEDILRAGAAKARRIATPMMARLREAVGLRAAAGTGAARADRSPGATRAGRARVVSFRDEDGRFRQRLFGADGAELLLSEPFDDPKALNRLGRAFAGHDLSALAAAADGLVALEDGGVCWARVPAGRLAAVQEALARL
ncbi:MAG: tryptophan--tRNA ligase, partial [Castellaniella sp.]